MSSAVPHVSSPRFGEHWARQWLDLARYADSNGFQADQLRESWAYRDWVIQALNDGMPFDRFTVEQLAGDLLPSATIDQQIAIEDSSYFWDLVLGGQKPYLFFLIH